MRHPGGEGAPSVADRVFVVLESCAGSCRPLSLVDLVERTGLPKTTLHRMCWKLVGLGMLEHADDGFRVGTKLFALGSMNPDLRRLRAAAMPYLHALVARTGWATNLAVMAEGRALIVEEVFGGSTRTMRRMVGGRLPLHATAVGKALLSGCSAEALDELLGTGSLSPYTRNTVVRPNLLRDQLQAARGSGLAFSHEEWSLGTSGVASPVVVGGSVVAAIAAVGPPGAAGLRQRGDVVRRAANGVANTLSPVVAAA